MDEINELLDVLRERPGLFIGKKSLDRLTTFVTGYIHCAYIKDGVMLQFLPGFQEFVENRYGKHSGRNWPHIIEFYSVYEEDAFDKFYDLLDEFREIQGIPVCNEKRTCPKLTDSNISCMDIVKNIVPYDRLAGALYNKFALKAFNRRIPVECLKKTNDKYYTVIKTEEGWVIVFFDSKQKLMYSQDVSISANTNKEKMNTLKEGMLLDEVKSIDPDGDYSFTHSNWLDFTQMSYHYLPDGNTYVISYDDDFCIKHIHTFVL